MSDERGTITLWMVGLVMVVLAVGGIALDLWRALAAHRYVAAVADAAAIAAGSGIDEDAWRFQGVLELDAARVDSLVATAVARQPEATDLVYSVVTAPDGSEASVTVATSVELTLLRLLVDGNIEVTAAATAAPIVSP